MSDFDTPLTRARRAHLDAIRDEMHALAATVPNPPTRVQVDDLWAHARQHTDDGEQARKLVLLAIRLGQSMGLSPSEALMRIDVIQGKATASAELVASNVRRAGHKLRLEVNQNPPTRVQVDDLWAHTRQHTDDGEQARKLVLSAIRLGWRPMGEQE